jgi:sulfotransferase
MKSFEKMFFMGGLPRTGSSLLTAILSQNSKILSEGISALLELMLLNEESIVNSLGIKEALNNTNRENSLNNIISQIPHLYYQDTPQEIIIDKQRSWTANVDLIKKYITKEPKIIVMLRPIKEIFESFYSLALKTNKLDWFYEKISFGPPFMNAFEFLKNSLESNKDYFFFIQYDNLLNKPKEVLKKVYDFFEIDYFEHNFDLIENRNQEGDYGIEGLHEVRSNISKRTLDVELPKNVLNRANYLQKDLEIAFEMAGIKDVF